MTYSGSAAAQTTSDNTNSDDTYVSTDDQISRINEVLNERYEDDTVPPQFPEIIGPPGNIGQYFTNPETGGLYKWVERTSLASPTNPGLSKKRLEKNSWIFVPHDADLTIGMFDPRLGNVWVDDNDAYVVYVYHAGELEYKDGIKLSNGWYAITDKKRGYDNFIIQTADDPKQLSVISGDYTNVSNPESVPDGVYLQQGFLYYNTSNHSLYVYQGEVDEYGNAIDPDGRWIQLNTGNTDPTDGQNLVSPYEELLNRFVAVEEKIRLLQSASQS